MKEWKQYRIGELVDLSQGQVINAQTNHLVVKEGIPLLRITDMINGTKNIFIDKVKVSQKNVAKPEDIIYTRTGQVGLVFKKQFGVVHNNCFKVIPKNANLDRIFLYWFLKTNSIYEYVNSVASGSAQPDLPHGAFKSITIHLPPVATQQRIASILSAYDDLIEVNNQRIKLLEETARELYKEWFVRMRFPGYKKAKFVKGIPKTWTIESLKDHITIVRGKSYTSEEIDDNTGDHAFINLKNMKRNGGFRFDGTKFFSGKFKKEQVVLPGDIVMAVTDMTQDRLIVGRVARVPLTEHKEYVISLDIVKIVSTKLSNDFIYSTLRFNYYGEHIAQFANGTNVLHLNPELLRKESILIPDEDLIKSFVQTVKPMFELVDVLAIEIEQLRQIRDRLLPRLISGKLEVKPNIILKQTEQD
jgi:type I restriction enzyme S subunit